MLLWQRIVRLSQTTVGCKYVSKVFVKTLKDSGLYRHLQSALQSRAPPHCMTHCMLAFWSAFHRPVCCHVIAVICGMTAVTWFDFPHSAFYPLPVHTTREVGGLAQGVAWIEATVKKIKEAQGAYVNQIKNGFKRFITWVVWDLKLLIQQIKHKKNTTTKSFLCH